LFSGYTTTAIGGGGGSYYNSGAGLNGGSGGGAGGHPSAAQNGGTATSGQGFNGGKGNSTAQGGGGGGGGASAVGVDGVTTVGGAGGAGAASSISGSSVTYAGGGGGGGVTPGAAGAGGGGAGTKSGTAGSGTANTGGGGGGEGDNAGTSGNGGSGVVIISYAGATQLMAGGTVTISGGNVIHTFTSSGYLTPIKYVGNSLRFRSSASAYLSRTPSAVGSRTTWTYSCWVKRGRLGADQALISAYTGTATINTQCSFMAADDTLDFYDNNGSYVFRLITTQAFRDPAAWYHIVLVLDTTQATASNRVKIYVNGTQITSFSTATYPPLNDATSDWNSNTEQRIGRHATNYFDVYFADTKQFWNNQLLWCMATHHLWWFVWHKWFLLAVYQQDQHNNLGV
jgi:hypothetical protein